MFITQVRMENMAKGCGRSENIEGVERRPRIVIPTVESKVDSLTTTTYTSTVYSTTYTFAVAVSTIDSISRYKTLPKAQRTRGLSSYHKFKQKS